MTVKALESGVTFAIVTRGAQMLECGEVRPVEGASVEKTRGRVKVWTAPHDIGGSAKQERQRKIMKKMKERNVKIVCTIGPSCWDYETLFKVAEAGMNVARLNFSHGNYESHERSLENIRAVEQERQTPIAVLLDTKGPEIRTGDLEGHVKVKLEQDAEFTLFFDKRDGNANGVYVDYAPLADEVEIGQSIFIDDGAINLEVLSTSKDSILCRVIVGGELGEHKGVNVPGANLSVPTLTERDIEDLRWGAAHDVDFVAVSFVRTKGDIMDVRRVLEQEGAKAKVIAKMETRQSVENVDDILPVVDGVMVARGDLGVEVNTEDVPMIQKSIIEKCRQQGKPVIVATQMLDSMIRNPRPTRAEANDVANAVIDGADAVMLSGETAGGKYPVQAVDTMHRIIVRTEREADKWRRRPRNLPTICETADAVCHAARNVAKEVGAAAIVSLTSSGGTARMVSKFRPPCKIIAMTPSISTWRQLCLVWGVIPCICPMAPTLMQLTANAVAVLRRTQLASGGENVVFTSGVPVGEPGNTSMLSVVRVADILGRGLSLVHKRMTAEVRVAFTPEEAEAKASEDTILVIKKSTKDYAKALGIAGAVIAEEDGLSSRASVISLDRDIPCVVGVPCVTSKLKDGMVVTIDGVNGLIYTGKAV